MTPLRPFIPPIGGGYLLEQTQTIHDRVRLLRGPKQDHAELISRALRSYYRNLRTGHVIEKGSPIANVA